MLDTGIVDTGVGREELVAIGNIVHILLDVARHGELIVQLERLGGVLARLHQCHLRHRLYVGKEVLAFKRGDILVHTAQLLLDHTQTLVDESGGAEGDLVAVFDPVFVIDKDQGTDDVFGTFGREIFQGDIGYGGIALRQGDSHIGTDGARHRFDTSFGEIDFGGRLLGIIHGGQLDLHLATGGGEGISHCTSDPDIHLITSQYKIGKGYLVFFLYLDGKREGGLLGDHTVQ